MILFKRFLKILSLGLLGLILLLLLSYLIFSIKSKRQVSSYLSKLDPEAPTLIVSGESYRDLNKNGKRDVYENINEPIKSRVEDLISQMNLQEKAGALFINMIGVNPDGSLMEQANFSDPFSFLTDSSSEMMINKNMNHFNTRAAYPKENMLKWYNSNEVLMISIILEYLVRISSLVKTKFK